MNKHEIQINENPSEYFYFFYWYFFRLLQLGTKIFISRSALIWTYFLTIKVAILFRTSIRSFYRPIFVEIGNGQWICFTSTSSNIFRTQNYIYTIIIKPINNNMILNLFLHWIGVNKEFCNIWSTNWNYIKKTFKFASLVQAFYRLCPFSKVKYLLFENQFRWKPDFWFNKHFTQL